MSSIDHSNGFQLRWTGHVIRMNVSRLPKAVFFGEFAKWKRLHGGQRLRYKDVVKRHLKATHIAVDTWVTLAQDRQRWRQAIHKGKSHFDENISQTYQHITISVMAFLMLLPLSSSVSTAGEAWNNPSSTNKAYTDVIIRRDGQQGEGEI